MTDVTTKSCPLGLTASEISDLMGGREDDFWHWMRGQTMMLCDGRGYDHETKTYYATECSPIGHGGVVFTWDAQRYLDGLPVID
jgi:hypothetical protein